MTKTEFCYWLQGYAEIYADAPDEVQWDIIKDKLAGVFDQPKLPAYQPIDISKYTSPGPATC